MDGRRFLKERTRFIRYYHDNARKGFDDIQRSVEDGTPPFDDPPYSEDGEPAFLEEWLDANTAADIVALSCITLLSDSLKLYLDFVRRDALGFEFIDEKKSMRSGFFPAYLSALTEVLGIDWTKSGIDVGMIEQVVLARNRGQHGGDLTTLDVTHDGKTLDKHPRPFFASEEEIDSWLDRGGSRSSFFLPSVRVTRQNLFRAIDEIERLADFIEKKIDA